MGAGNRSVNTALIRHQNNSSGLRDLLKLLSLKQIWRQSAVSIPHPDQTEPSPAPVSPFWHPKSALFVKKGDNYFAIPPILPPIAVNPGKLRPEKCANRPFPAADLLPDRPCHTGPKAAENHPAKRRPPARFFGRIIPCFQGSPIRSDFRPPKAYISDLFSRLRVRPIGVKPILRRNPEYLS